MNVAKISTKGQVTLPAEVRKRLGASTGDFLVFEEAEGDAVTIRPLKRRSIAELYGSLPATRPFPGKSAVRAEVAAFLASGKEK
jgi:antitoxin PrlF